MSPSLDILAADPAKASTLDPTDRARVQLSCAAILSALAIATSPPPPEVLLEVDEAAERLKCSKTTVYEMMRDGRLRYVLKGEKRGKLVPIAALDDFVKRQSRRGRNQPSLDAVRAAVGAIR